MRETKIKCRYHGAIEFGPSTSQLPPFERNYLLECAVQVLDQDTSCEKYDFDSVEEEERFESTVRRIKRNHFGKTRNTNDMFKDGNPNYEYNCFANINSFVLLRPYPQQQREPIRVIQVHKTTISAHFRSEAHPRHWMFVGKDPLKGTIAGRAIYLFEFETIADRRRMEQMFNHMTRATPSLGSSGQSNENFSNNEDNNSTIDEAHSPSGSFSGISNSNSHNTDFSNQYTNPYAKIVSQKSSFQLNVTEDNRRWTILYRPKKTLSSDPVKSSFLECILFAVNKDDYFEKYNIRDIRQMYKSSDNSDYKQAIFKALNRCAFIVKENQMKEQWKPVNAIGNNDYPIWLGQEENGNFVLLDEQRWTLDTKL